MANAIMIIAPYWWQGTWVFDDPGRGLTREPFVSGIPEMIDRLVTDIPGARNGFRLLFSATPFPGYQQAFEWDRNAGREIRNPKHEIRNKAEARKKQI